ncbi:MAG: (p)ppGpp synthetase SpoT/RelA, partial [Frankiales bacterium]|nr:(p)ppGpp synthetase SpoT/RelA [Frankiales bacterium]
MPADVTPVAAPEPAAPELPAPAAPVDEQDDVFSGPPTGRRMRARLARLTATATKPGGLPPVLEPLARTVYANHPKADLKVVQRAYETAERFHEGQRRKSGDPYITHPLAVTTIL